MMKTTRILLKEINGYSSPRSKLSSTADNEEYFPVAKGLHETNKSTTRYLLAGSASATHDKRRKNTVKHHLATSCTWVYRSKRPILK